MERNLPPVTPLSEPFFAGCRAGRLRLQCCEDCGRRQFYPRILCSACGSRALAWRDSAGSGHIASFTVVRRALSSAYRAPYVVVLVDLDEGVRLMSQLVNCDPDRVAVGDRVAVRFERWADDIVLPVFTPVEEGETS
jgi:uncharacterized OB-fold protein